MKILLVFVLMLVNIFTFFSVPAQASSDEIIYARILTNNVCFYSAPSDSSALFYIPNSYFVQLLDNAGENYYTARYSDLFGYVKKSEVTPVVGTPITPYAEKLSFRVISLNGLELRSVPRSSSPFEIVDNVPYLETDLVYYGQMAGDSLVPECTNIWYYCKYLDGTTSSMGYLYSLFCDKLTTIPTNTEVMEVRTEPIFVEEENSGTTSTLNFSSPTQILIVVAVCLPCLLIIYLLFKPTRIAKKESEANVKTKKIKRLKRSDYYELDD